MHKTVSLSNKEFKLALEKVKNGDASAIDELANILTPYITTTIGKRFPEVAKATLKEFVVFGIARALDNNCHDKDIIYFYQYVYKIVERKIKQMNADNELEPKQYIEISQVEYIPADSDPEKECIRAEAMDKIYKLSGQCLKNRERFVLDKRYNEGLTLEAVGKLLEISREAVSQIEKRAFEKIKKAIKNSPEDSKFFENIISDLL